jgi:hypothetical protein
VPDVTVRVASVPAGHVYVRHLSRPDGPDRVRRLPDPAPERPVVGAPWWPPRILDRAWLVEHRFDYDLVHVHFGFDALSPADLHAWTRTLRVLERPLVVTVHDLRNPHHEHPGLHDAQLGVLVGAADTVITLTHGAAAEIRRRWGVRSRVLPHPHVVGIDDLTRPRPQRPGLRVGIHCKSLRAGMDPLPVVETAARVLGHLPGASLVVDVHTDVVEPGGAHHDARLVDRLRDLEQSGALRTSVHDYYSDRELLDYLLDLDVSVLPYRFGTHSGWLEACHDLGTTVVAPDCGYYSEQRPCLTYTHGDERSLATALESAHAERFTWRASLRDRLAERHALADAHEEVYRSVLGEELACTS